MKLNPFGPSLCGLTLIAALGIVLTSGGAPVRAADPPARNTPWTLEEAQAQLRLYPRDAYLQYVVLMLERQKHGDATPADESLPLPRRTPGRGTEVDLFNLFSGSAAVQESLQLDTMHGEPAVAQPARTRRRPPTNPAGKGRRPSAQEPEDERVPTTKPVPIATINGPTIKSHPWEKMLAGRKPEISRLAGSVPADFYFIQFHSLTKLLDTIDTSDLWGRHLFSQAWQEARTQLFAKRIRQQLAVEIDPVLRPFYDGVVSQIAVTGSDLYAREGSDVTLLFRVKEPAIFRARMDSFLTEAEKSYAEARRSEGEYQGVRYVEVSTPDRRVHVFSAYPEPDLHVRSNSQVALERVIDAIRGKDRAGQPVKRLGDMAEFAYIRTLMPERAAEEDGFIYLSDPFIRRLVGPQVKLTERRRMLCYNHLRMIGHAALFYRTQHGKNATSLAELAESKSSPGEFGKGRLACHDGGTYSLSPDGLTAVCSHHGHAHDLIPCCEIPIAEATRVEQDQYAAFLAAYNQYWRTYFDPIAVRIQMQPERYRIETIVLPLIDNTVYSTLAQATSGPPAPLDALPVPKRNIFSVAVRLNKAAVAKLIGAESLIEGPDSPTAAAPDTIPTINNLSRLGQAWHNYHDVNMSFPTAAPKSHTPPREQNAGLSWRVRLLPYVENTELYNQFNMDEPWDSPTNKALISKMPAIYRPRDPKLAGQYKTRLVATVGDKLITTKKGEHVNIESVTDGMANTIMVAEADDRHAVIWTKPDDLEVDLAKPMAGLFIRPPGGFLVLMADAKVKFLRSNIKPATLTALFTRAGGEKVTLTANEQFPLAHQGPGDGLFSGADETLRELQIREFLTKGIGDEIGVHLYDSDPLFAFSLPTALGQALGNFNGPGAGGFGGNEMLLIGLVISALQSPVYISVPVHDAQIVDNFLDRLDRKLAGLARQSESVGGFLEFSQDFYRMREAGIPIRTFAFQIGPIKWRFFWARIGNGLYIASKPFILKDLAALESTHPTAQADAEPPAHGMVRLRAGNWNRVLSSYKLGWAENNRAACVHNLGPLSSLARSVVPATERKAGANLPAEIRHLGETIYDTDFYCPDGGHYVFDADGSVACSLHGSALSPRQTDAPSSNTALGQLLGSLSDMTVLLTFREEGLHAVVTIERKKEHGTR